MTDMIHNKSPASVIESSPWLDGRQTIVLDQTIFYHEGGGQPYDKGVIKAANADFEVEEIRFKDGTVYHIGKVT